MHLLPLSEIIATVIGVAYPGVQKVWDVYNRLISKFGDEYTVLIQPSMEEMCKVVEPKIAEAVVRVREEKVKVIPGYDGVYGQLVLFEEEEREKPSEKLEKIKQRSLADFI
jgi:PHP family Zn ribbon phosphoesterase